MIANLYLHADALKYNGTDSKEEFYDKFNTLLSDLNDIRNEYGEENAIHMSSSLYDGSVTLFEKQNLFIIVEGLEREERNFMYSLMVNNAALDSLTLDDLCAKTVYDANETECNAVVYLNKPKAAMPDYPIEYITFDRYEIVYGRDSWRTLRRQIMGNHPGTPEEFMRNCAIYFPDIVFHSNCTASVNGYLELIPRKIVYYLSCMNDKFLDHIKNAKTTDENALLSDFCGKYGFDEAGTRQGTPKKKTSYQFDFLKNGCEDKPCNYKTITCDPHMKMSSCDRNCKKPPKDFVGRIYFHFGDPEVAQSKILVGSIGPHI